MLNRNCLNCGSTNLRADRALAGRIICNDCGSPLGVKSYKRRFDFNLDTRKKSLMLYFIVGLAIVLLLSRL